MIKKIYNMHGVLPNTIKSDSGKTHKKPGSRSVFSARVKLNLVEQTFLQGGKDLYLLQSSALCEHLYPPAGKDPFCWEACCNWRIWKQSFKQFMVAMEVALSINRSWSKDVRWPETGRHSMLLIKSLCWPSAWDIICQSKQSFIRWWKCVVIHV